MIDILIVDDDPGIGSMLQVILEYEGYNVAYESNGAEALHRMVNKQDIPRALLVDVSMPVMDGPTLIQRMKEYPILRQISIFVMTAELFPEQRLQGMKIEGLFAKPFPVDRLIDTMQHILLQPPAA
jgi:CheY-like chemotaxis protein